MLLILVMLSVKTSTWPSFLLFFGIRLLSNETSSKNNDCCRHLCLPLPASSNGAKDERRRRAPSRRLELRRYDHCDVGVNRRQAPYDEDRSVLSVVDRWRSQRIQKVLARVESAEEAAYEIVDDLPRLLYKFSV